MSMTNQSQNQWRARESPRHVLADAEIGEGQGHRREEVSEGSPI